MRRLARVPAAAEPEVLAVVAELALRLDERSADIAREMAFMMAHEIDQLDADAKLLEMLEASVQGNITTIIHVLANDIPIDHLQPTTAAVEYALRLAQRDVPSNSLVRAYHMGQGDLMRICHDEISTLDIPARLTLAVLKHTSDVVYSYIDWITLYVFDAYERERSRWMAAQGNLHSAAIHALLSGTNADTAAFEAETGYRLGQNHVALVVWSTWDADVMGINTLDRLVRDLGAAAGADKPPIITAIDRRTVWAWLPFGRRVPAPDPEVLAAAVPLDGGARVAIGLPGSGVDGFKRSHEQATAAYSVAAVPDTPQRPVVSFGDRGVAVVSLLSENIDSTKSWVWEVLGPLAEDTPSAASLRTTLSVYFAHGESHLHTANHMNLHRNTVKYRINKALGDPVAAGRDKLDLALALQVCELLGRSVLRPAKSS
ncbi:MULTISPECIES: PucR family transcriptional regulator [Rhodococcus]|uniref:PucR family transcriptional regulator n=1 Tax=Rhodococcus TaxID=1827 RepID=UPI0002B7DF4D|nr:MULTISPECIES: helix-turn-helix domain-containing protein [Rhodococcus]AZI65323.1 PucR family transcriptional regulator [Rhodococcus sp. NJ-530]EME21598.1 CdaR family transcriptional regulator [Rhodococcus qingshengii BKS 20-40]